jgi:hypothetical protein
MAPKPSPGTNVPPSRDLPQECMLLRIFLGEAFLPELKKMMCNGLITTERAQIVRYQA